MFGGSKKFDPSKFKAQCNLALVRVRLQKQKKQNLSQTMKREIADLVRAGDEGTAQIKAEQLMHDDYVCEALEILETQLSELAIKSLVVANCTGAPPPDLAEILATVIYAAPRLSIPEFTAVRDQLGLKFGRQYVFDCANDKGHCVQPNVKAKLSIGAGPDQEETVYFYLKSICELYHVPFTREIIGDAPDPAPAPAPGAALPPPLSFDTNPAPSPFPTLPGAGAGAGARSPFPTVPGAAAAPAARSPFPSVPGARSPAAPSAFPSIPGGAPAAAPARSPVSPSAFPSVPGAAAAGAGAFPSPSRAAATAAAFPSVPGAAAPAGGAFPSPRPAATAAAFPSVPGAAAAAGAFPSPSRAATTANAFPSVPGASPRAAAAAGTAFPSVPGSSPAGAFPAPTPGMPAPAPAFGAGPDPLDGLVLPGEDEIPDFDDLTSRMEAIKKRR